MTILSESAEEVLEQLVADFEEGLGETLFPGDARHQFLSQFVPVILALEADINAKAGSNLLQGAKGQTLDAYGRQYNVPRRPSTSAIVQVELTLAVPLSYDILIPKGARVTPDGSYNFLVERDTTVTAQKDKVVLTAVAERPGSDYNGFVPGQIRTLVDPIPYVSAVINTTASSGGTDEEVDDSYRERIRTSYSVTSTAGSYEGYDYFARTAHPDILDVEISVPSEQVVQVCVLGPDGGASEAIKEAVSAALSAKDHRPMTDQVTVVGPTQKSFEIALTYYIAKADYTQESAIRAAVTAAVAAYTAQCSTRLGGAINPDTLRRNILAAGGYRIDITAPVYTELLGHEVAVVGNVTVAYGGIL